MGVDRFADVGRLAAHLDGQADFADEVACVRPHDATANHTMARRIEQQLGEAQGKTALPNLMPSALH